MLALRNLHLKAYNKPSGDLLHLFWSGVSRRVAASLLWVFSPVYIYTILMDDGFSSQYALMFVSGWYLLLFLSKIIFLVISEDLSQRSGFKGLMKISVIPFILSIVGLIYADQSTIALILAAVFSGMHSGLYWLGYHGYFVKSANKHHFGENIGEMDILSTTAGVITPLIGGILVTIFGFNALFVLSGVFMIISAILIGKNHDKRQKRDIKFAQVLHLMNKHKGTTIAYVGSAAEGTIKEIAWPIFLFIFFAGFIKLGFIYYIF